MFTIGTKVKINKSTEKLDKPDYRPYFGKTLTIQSQPYVGRYTVEEAGTLIFCDWMLEEVKEAKTGKVKSKKVKTGK